MTNYYFCISNRKYELFPVIIIEHPFQKYLSQDAGATLRTPVCVILDLTLKRLNENGLPARNTKKESVTPSEIKLAFKSASDHLCAMSGVFFTSRKVVS